MKVKGHCSVCGKPFWYQAKARKVRGVMPRRRCEECDRILRNDRKRQKRESTQMNKSKSEAKLSGRPSAESNITGSYQMIHAQIAKELKLSRTTVAEIERRALLKVRKDPELMELWHKFKEEGLAHGQLQIPEDGLFNLGKIGPPPGERLLNFELELVDWWHTYDRLMDAGGQEIAPELRECLLEIQRCHKEIGETISGLNDEAPDEGVFSHGQWRPFCDAPIRPRTESDWF
jgi:transcriptional regulator with XRE-family HTH domain